MGRVGRTIALRCCLTATLGVATTSAALAQRWTIEPSLSSQLTWTSNAVLGSGPSQDDTVLGLRPRLLVRAEGDRLRLSGAVALNSFTYLSGSQSSRVFPEGELTARLEAVQRWLYLEGSVRAAQTSPDAFGAFSESVSTANKVTTGQVRLSPTIESSIGSQMRYRIRSDNSWTRQRSGDSAAVVVSDPDGYFGRHAAFIEHDPRPFGWRFEAERSDTRYRDGVTPALVNEVERVMVDYALTPELSLGLRGGYERSNFFLNNDRDVISGVQARWLPSPRTQLAAFAERRIFGSGWSANFDHRTSQLAITFSLARGIQSAPQSLVELPATGNVEALLLELFKARYPDPTERARFVRQFIVDQGLPASTLSPTRISSKRLSLVTSRNASVGLVGVRNSLVLSAFSVLTEDLPDASALANGLDGVNNLQYGGGLTWSHRLTQVVNVSTAAFFSRIRSLDGSETTSQRGIRFQASLQLAPKTSAVFGSSYSKVNSTVVTAGHESQVFAGFDHRF
jgi:uncharacterized protein (PEP-CTERM system associated)